MQKLVLLLAVLFTFQIDLLALSVSASPSDLLCGSTTVTFTFDCPFDGLVLVPNTPPDGITYSNFPNSTSNFWDVVNGQVTADVNVPTNTMGTYDITFIILSSNQACAIGGSDVVMTTLNYNCIGPVNDDCINALPIGIAHNTCSFLNFSTVNTSQTGPNPSCDPTTIYVDLWYSFYPNSSTITLDYNENPGILGIYALYDDCPNNGGTEMNCGTIINTGSENFSGLNVNTKYYLQFKFHPVENGTNQSFCLRSSVAPDPCPYQVAISDMGPNNSNLSYLASDIIETSGSTIVTTLGVIYDAGNCVQLNPGFECTADFEVRTIGCTP